MNKRAVAIGSLIAHIGCVPEIRIDRGDVHDTGGDRFLIIDALTDLPSTEVMVDSGLIERTESEHPDTQDVAMALDGMGLTDLVPEAAPDAELSDGQAIVVDATVDAQIDRAETDRACGVCVAANSVSLCVGAVCRIDHCSAGFGDCNSQYTDGCETVLNSVENCGRCGGACGVAGTCVEGACVIQRSCPSAPERGCGLANVPGGAFQMGSPESSTGEPLAGRVTVSALLVDTHEVSVARFRRFWNAGHPIPSGPVRYPNGVNVSVGNVSEPLNPATGSFCNWRTSAGAHEAHPVNCIDWATAQAFCVWDGGRLPTEAELEYLSRYRPVTGYPSPRRYPWGNEDPIEMYSTYPRPTPCERAQFQDCVGDDGARTRRVGSFTGTGGLFDLSGNVKEWAADAADTYGFAPCWGPTPVDLLDPVCTVTGTTRSVRGGAFRSAGATVLLGAARDAAGTMSVDDQLGFRCVRSP